MLVSLSSLVVGLRLAARALPLPARGYVPDGTFFTGGLDQYIRSNPWNTNAVLTEKAFVEFLEAALSVPSRVKRLGR